MSRWPIITVGKVRVAGMALAALAATASPARAACPIELATYGQSETGARVEFSPAPKNAAVTNTFRLLLGNDVLLDGIVMWTEGVSRPNGLLTYQCPLGDVTGEEYEACTVWQGVIYTSDRSGTIGLLPSEGKEAPELLVLPDLGPSVQAAPALAAHELQDVPWDVFSKDGCQE